MKRQMLYLSFLVATITGCSVADADTFADWSSPPKPMVASYGKAVPVGKTEVEPVVTQLETQSEPEDQPLSGERPFTFKEAVERLDEKYRPPLSPEEYVRMGICPPQYYRNGFDEAKVSRLSKNGRKACEKAFERWDADEALIQRVISVSEWRQMIKKTAARRAVKGGDGLIKPEFAQVGG